MDLVDLRWSEKRMIKTHYKWQFSREKKDLTTLNDNILLTLKI